MECPKCRSWRIRRSSRWGFLPVWFLFPLARCQDCAHLFHVPFWKEMPSSLRPSEEQAAMPPKQKKRRRSKRKEGDNLNLVMESSSSFEIPLGGGANSNVEIARDQTVESKIAADPMVETSTTIESHADEETALTVDLSAETSWNFDTNPGFENTPPIEEITIVETNQEISPIKEMTVENWSGSFFVLQDGTGQQYVSTEMPKGGRIPLTAIRKYRVAGTNELVRFSTITPVRDATTWIAKKEQEGFTFAPEELQ